MTADNDRIHQRIDDLSLDVRDSLKDVSSGLSTLTSEVREVNALCGVCRPIVFGNGKESIDSRVTTLEVERHTERRAERKWTGRMWLLTTAIAASAGTMGAALFQFFTRGSNQP